MAGHDLSGLGELDEPLSDDELAAIALAADTDAVVSDDAISVWELTGTRMNGPLPSWYMPAPMGAPRFSGWRGRLVRCTIFSVIASFVVINAYGLCNTYDQLHF